MYGFHLSELEVQKKSICVLCGCCVPQTQISVIGNSCDILCKCGSKVEGHLNVTLGYGSASTRYQVSKESHVSLGMIALVSSDTVRECGSPQ